MPVLPERSAKMLFATFRDFRTPAGSGEN